MNIFIATAMSGLSKQEYKNLKDSIQELANSPSDNVFAEILNIEHNNFQTPKGATTKDINEIEKSDLFILFHVSNILSSSLFELGIAFALNKKIVIIHNEQNELQFMLKELDQVSTKVKIITINELHKIGIDILT